MMYGDNGKFLTQAIFYEMSSPEMRVKYPPLFTLKDKETHGLPSAYEIYINSVDEYEAAMKIAGSMRNWRLLCSASWFMDGDPSTGHEGLAQWREDMKARDTSLAKAQLAEAAENGNVAAMKTLYGGSPIKRVPKKKLKKKDDNITSIVDRMKNL